MRYNCRVYDYPSGQHVSIYSRDIMKYETEEELALLRQRQRKRQAALRRKEINAMLDGEKETYEQLELFPEEGGEGKGDGEEKKREQHSLRVSVSRTKNTIYNIARSEKWEWFITLTFDRKKTDAKDYDAVTGRLQVFLNNLQKRSCPGLKYLIVPEFHGDGEHYHFHGLLSCCGGLKFRYSGHDTKDGEPVFNITNWTWGFTTATRVTDTRRASSYVTKYITKESQVSLKGRHRYYCSRNITRVGPEFYTVDEKDFLETYAGEIAYASSASALYQNVNYYELN